MASSLRDLRYRRIIDRLKAARLAAGLSQQELADSLGKPQSYVAKIEGCERRLDVLEFLLIARCVGLDTGILSKAVEGK